MIGADRLRMLGAPKDLLLTRIDKSETRARGDLGRVIDIEAKRDVPADPGFESIGFASRRSAAT